MTQAIAVVPFLPSPANWIRLKDLLHSVKRYEPGRIRFIILVDGPELAKCSQLLESLGLPGHSIRNPRKWPKGNRGGSPRLTCGILAAVREAVRSEDWDFLLKIDDDALITGPFLDRLADIAIKNPAVGMFGGYQFGTPMKPGESNCFSAAFYRRSKLLRFHRDIGGCWFSAWGWRRHLRLLLVKAAENGYIAGEWCQGGAYLLTRACAKAIAEEPLLREPLVFSQCNLPEDACITIAARSTGAKIWYEDHEQRLFALAWKTLPLPPEILLERGYSIIHAVRAVDAVEEQRMRNIFRNHAAV